MGRPKKEGVFACLRRVTKEEEVAIDELLVKLRGPSKLILAVPGALSVTPVSLPLPAQPRPVESISTALPRDYLALRDTCKQQEKDLRELKDRLKEYES